jgi:hypothetical protein
MIATAYAAMILGVIGFQIALILGAPWGRLTQGGRADGPLGRAGRIAAAASILILVGMALGVLSAEGRWPHWPPWTGWAAVGVTAVSMTLNWITPSKPERALWGPMMTIMLGLALAVHWV